MKGSKGRKLYVLLAVVFAIVAVMPAVSVFAGSDITNIFRDDFESTEIDDFKWELSNKDTEAISIDKLGTDGITVKNGDWNVIRYKEGITLAEGESMQIQYTMSNTGGLGLMPSLNPVSDYEDETVENPFGGIYMRPGGGIHVGTDYLFSLETDFVFNYSGLFPSAAVAGGAYHGNTMHQKLKYEDGQWVSAATSIGDPDWTNTWLKPLEVKAVFDADGSAVYSVRHEGDAEFATAAIVESGIGYRVHDTDPNFSVLTEEEPEGRTRSFRNIEDVAVYPAIASANLAGGGAYSSIYNVSLTKVGADQTETVVSDDYLDWTEFLGADRIAMGESEDLLIVDNAADDDYILKASKISATANTINSKLYDIDLEILVDRLTEDGEAVVYVGASDKDMTGAAEIYFKKDGANTVVGIRNGDVAPTEVVCNFEAALAIFKALKIVGLNTNVNEVYVDGVKVGEFEKKLADTYFAIGTKKKTGTAMIAVKSAVMYKYSYLQGTGDDFTEEFQDGKYNYENLLIQIHPDFEKDKAVSIENGSLKLKDAFGVTISTVESYSDFEFTMNISSMGGQTDANDETIPLFGMAFGKPQAEAGESAFWLQWQRYGAAVLPGEFPNVGYVEGYSGWSAPFGDLNVYVHDYSTEEVIVKFVKQGTNMDLYMYLPSDVDNEDPELAKRVTTPFCRYQNVYGSGNIDVRCLATGLPLTMGISSISVKNLDETKGTLNQADENSRQEIQYQEEDDEDLNKPVPPVDETESGCGGCGGDLQSSGVAAMGLALLAAASLLYLKRM